MVRQALRDLGVPSRLAANELASGEALEQRAESVRARLADATEHAFGETADERLLRRVLVRGYLDPAPSHELAAKELNLSRAAYFRRLKKAVCAGSHAPGLGRRALAPRGAPAPRCASVIASLSVEEISTASR